MTAATVVLPVLGGIVAVLLCLPVISPRLPVGAAASATAGLCLVALLGTLAVALFGGVSLLASPIALGLTRGVLALDPLAAWFLLAIATAGLATACANGGTRWQPALLATAMLTVLAGDVGTVLIAIAGFAALCGANRPAAFGVLLIAGSLAVLSLGVGSTFAAIRPVPPEGWRAGIVMALLLAGLLLVGWAGPFQRLAEAVAPPSTLFTLGPAVLGYVLCRVVLELCGPATPSWWGAPLLLTGSALAAAGALYALRAQSLHAVLAGLAALHGGWLLAATGVIAVGRAADLLPLATLAAGGLLLHVLNLAVFGSLACIAADAAARGAGSYLLDRLGGLASGMPVAALAVLVAGWSLAFLPPSAGFASGWMLLQALFAATRLGGLALHLVLAVTAIALAGSAALAAIAMVRLGATAFLGRPRTPRASATEEAARPARLVMLSLVGVVLAAGLLPGLLVQLAGPAQQWLTRAQMEGQADWAGLHTQHAAPGYLPITVALLVCVVAGCLWAWRRRLPGLQTTPLWEDGFDPPPAWMPFGDPATQVTPAVLANLLPRGIPRLSWPLRIRVHVEWPQRLPSGATVLLGLAVALLLVVLLLGPPLLAPS